MDYRGSALLSVDNGGLRSAEWLLRGYNVDDRAVTLGVDATCTVEERMVHAECIHSMVVQWRASVAEQRRPMHPGYRTSGHNWGWPNQWCYRGCIVHNLNTRGKLIIQGSTKGAFDHSRLGQWRGQTCMWPRGSDTGVLAESSAKPLKSARKLS
jgi:hypothetical protein